ncbi:DNA cytosine methyltransferase [Streptomyces sp. NPDC088812]|uniref:DNA cytosine methyltransferase n=1 Tax=Streptomyces sp. NPDC088812 TaxID=3365905 RepID=UPI003822332F
MSHVTHTPSSPAVFRIVDLFAGPGGLDVAAEVLGHRVTGIEWDDNACKTRAAAGMDTFAGDVREYRAAHFPHAQVLTGGPPCQTFTVAGHGAGRRALDDVLKYIARLHEAVRSESTPWREVFRTWRGISEELRHKAAEAETVKAAKREVEAVRSATRKAAGKNLADHGCSSEEIKLALKTLEAPLGLARRDADLKDLFDGLASLEKSLDAHRIRLEELGDERTGLVLQPLWWVIERSRRPGLVPYEAVVLEQVPAVMRVWEEYEKVLTTLGYRTRTQMMHTEAFGVPQTRRRAVLMARFGTTDIPALKETHERYRPSGAPAASGGADRTDGLLWDVDDKSVGRSEDEPKSSWVSMEAALKKARDIALELDLPDLDLPDRPAFTVVSNYGTGGDPSARGRRDHDAPSSTVTGKVSRNRLVHKGTDTDLPRFGRFELAEAGVLQTFPVAYPWRGGDRSQQIGNAVPPQLALHVLRHVLEPELSDKEARARTAQAVADLENWCPPSEPVRIRRRDDLKGHPLTGG